MNDVLKLTAVCITCALLAASVRKYSPEMALLMGICTALGCVWVGIELFQSISERIIQWQKDLGMATELFRPLMKCAGISITAQLGSNVCKDSGHSAAAAGIELCANLASVWCLLPLVNYMFSIVREML